MNLNNEIVRKDRVVDRLAKTERQTIEIVVAGVNKILNETATLPVSIPEKDFFSPVVREKVFQLLKAAGWRVAYQPTADPSVIAPIFDGKVGTGFVTLS